MLHLLLEIFEAIGELGAFKHREHLSSPTSISPWVVVVAIILSGAVIGWLSALALL